MTEFVGKRIPIFQATNRAFDQDTIRAGWEVTILLKKRTNCNSTLPCPARSFACSDTRLTSLLTDGNGIARSGRSRSCRKNDHPNSLVVASNDLPLQDVYYSSILKFWVRTDGADSVLLPVLFPGQLRCQMGMWLELLVQGWKIREGTSRGFFDRAMLPEHGFLNPILVLALRQRSLHPRSLPPASDRYGRQLG
jgi:hypothetical protein